MNQDDYMTFAEAMEYLGMDRQKLRRLIKSWKLPTYENAMDRRQAMLRRSQIVDIKNNPMREKPIQEKQGKGTE